MSDEASATVEEPRREDASERERVGAGTEVEGASEAMARAISSLVGGVIGDFEHSAEATSRSQDELSSSLDRLTRGRRILLTFSSISSENFVSMPQLKIVATFVFTQRSSYES